MDPVRNPYAPGAGQRPPELAGRDRELESFNIVLQRVSRGRPERSLVLTGLRGVGKTVLLNTLRGSAVKAGWGTGKLEARPDVPVRRALASAMHLAVRELGVRASSEVEDVMAVVKAFALRVNAPDAKLRDRWEPGIPGAPAVGRADSGDIEIDLVELFSDVAGLAASEGKGVAIFIDEMQDLMDADIAALCQACHELSQEGLPLIVVGAGLPHLPAVLSASKSYSERLFKYMRIDRLDRIGAEQAFRTPAKDEDADFTDEALAALYEATEGYPYFVQAYGSAVWDAAPTTPITADDVAVATPEAEAELAVGFFGSRLERATGAEQDYMRAMSELAPDADGHVATSDVATALGRKPQSVSPARDGLIKKGLVYSGARGRIAFTVPHFGRYLRAHSLD